MARERTSTTIDGHRYEMTQLGATEGFRLFHRLGRMLGPSVGYLFEAVADAKGIQDVDLSSELAIAAVKSLTENVSEADLAHVVDKLKNACHVGVDGSEKTIPLTGVFEMHFSGRMLSMFKWLAWGLKVQYADFGDAFANMRTPSADGGSLASSNPTH